MRQACWLALVALLLAACDRPGGFGRAAGSTGSAATTSATLASSSSASSTASSSATSSSSSSSTSSSSTSSSASSSSTTGRHTTATASSSSGTTTSGATTGGLGASTTSGSTVSAASTSASSTGSASTGSTGSTGASSSTGTSSSSSGSSTGTTGAYPDGGCGPLVRAGRYPVGPYPVEIALGDVDGDGKPDLAVADSASGELSILRGNGDGTFQAEQRVAAMAKLRSVALADLDGDGRADAVVAGSNSSQATVLLAQDGGFAPGPTVTLTEQSSGTLSAHHVRAGDLDGDGRPDLVLTSAGRSVGFFVNAGDGGFVTWATGATYGAPLGPILADMNGDGLLDLIAADDGQASVEVLLGHANSLIGPYQGSLIGLTSGATVGDFDGDGHPDVAATTEASGTTPGRAWVMLGRGDGSLRPWSFSLALPAGREALTTADLDGDGRLDLAVVSDAAPSISLLPGNGDGTFRALPACSTGDRPYAVVSGDLDGDGRPDLVIADWGPSGGQAYVEVWLAR